MSLWLFCIYSNSNGWINHLHWFLSIVCTDFFNILIFSLLSPKPGCSVVCFYCLYSLGCWSHLPGSLLCAWTFMKGPQSLRIIPFISKGLYFLPCNMKNKGMIPSMKAEIELGWGWVGFQGFWKTWFSSGLSLSFECGLSQLWILTVLPCRGCILVLPPCCYLQLQNLTNVLSWRPVCFRLLLSSGALSSKHSETVGDFALLFRPSPSTFYTIPSLSQWLVGKAGLYYIFKWLLFFNCSTLGFSCALLEYEKEPEDEACTSLRDPRFGAGVSILHVGMSILNQDKRRAQGYGEVKGVDRCWHCWLSTQDLFPPSFLVTGL